MDGKGHHSLESTPESDKTMKFLVLALLVASAAAAAFPQGRVAEPISVKVEQAVKKVKPVTVAEKVEEKVDDAVPQGRSFSGFAAPRYNYNNNNQQSRFDQYQNRHVESTYYKPQPYKPYEPKPYKAIDPVPYKPEEKPAEYISKNVNYGPDQNAEVLRSVADVGPEGFNYAYETANGISAGAQGSLKKFNDKEQAVVVHGSYRYTAPDGTPVVFTYIADENGYQPQSDLLPQAPPVPEAIARSLEYYAKNGPKTETHYH